MNSAERQAHADQATFPRRDQPQQQTVRGVPCLEQTEATMRLMRRVTVQSLAFAAAQDIIPQNATQAAKLAAVIACGPTYQSCVFFQPGVEA